MEEYCRRHNETEVSRDGGRTWDLIRYGRDDIDFDGELFAT